MKRENMRLEKIAEKMLDKLEERKEEKRRKCINESRYNEVYKSI